MTAKVLSKSLCLSHDLFDCWIPGSLEFKLSEPLEVLIDGDRYRSPIGMSTDGASTPRVFRSLVPRVGRHIYGAIIHDACYRGKLEKLCDNGAGGATWENVDVTREWSDEAFLKLMISTNTGRLTRKLAYFAVRLLGMWSYQG